MRIQVRFLARVAVVLSLSLFVTIVCVHFSEKWGSLTTVFFYDDVVYFTSATDLIQSAKSAGLSGFLDFAQRDRFHSPYSILLAALSFSILGPNDAAPYYGNYLLVVAFLSFIAYLLRRLPLSPFILCLILFASLPFVTMCVTECRPDLAWATFLGFSVTYLITEENLLDSFACCVSYAALLSITLLIKPSAFAMTILVSSLACCARGILEFLQPHSISKLVPRLMRGLLIVAGTLIILVGPYAYAYGKDVWQYFYDSVFGPEAQIWVYKGPNPWLYYISGNVAESNLGKPGIIIIIMTFSLIVAEFMQRARNIKAHLLTLALIILIAYTINSMAALKSPVFGGAFYGTLIFSAAFAFGSSRPLFNRLSKVGQVMVNGVLLSITVLALLLYRWPVYCDKRPYQAVCKFMRQAQESVIQSFHGGVPPKRILFTQYSPLIPFNLEIWYLQQGLRPIFQCSGNFLQPEEFKTQIEACDVVITQETGIMSLTSFLPDEKSQDDFVKIMKADSRFEITCTVKDPNGKVLYVFRRR